MKIALSILVDNNPTILMQAWNFIVSFNSNIGTKDGVYSILVHYTTNVELRDISIFSHMGATLIPVDPFDHGVNARYCNKIRQLQTDIIRNYDYVILCDCDILFNVDTLDGILSNSVRGKLVDYPNPPAEILSRLVEMSGIRSDRSWVPIPLSPENKTLSTNCNGGVYCIPNFAINKLGNLWDKWARYCLSEQDILGRYAHHADQIGFALAILEGEIPFEPLDVAYNFPTHLREGEYSKLSRTPIYIFHYHNNMNDHGIPRGVGVAWIDQQMSQAARRLSEDRRPFLNKVFWDFRYIVNPEIGSGIGSRGEFIHYKYKRILPYLLQHADKNVLDVGCGDLEIMQHAPVKEYSGVDISIEALTLAASKRPNWKFTNKPLNLYNESSYSLVVCLDVAIHQSNSTEYQRLISELVRISSDIIIVSGFSSPPPLGGIVFFHEPISDTLRNHPEIAEVWSIGNYRGLDLIVAKKRGASTKNKNDIGDRELSYGLKRTATPELLMELVTLSRELLGFFPKTIIRAIEYPWIASRLKGCAGARVLDVGAGVCVLPLWLARQGGVVTTIDHHSTVREGNADHTWNEWGFLDYSRMDNKIVSVHGDVIHQKFASTFDVIYCVSVIEHMQASDRRLAIEQMAKLLRPRGRLLITVDLIPGSDDLWDYSEGKRVDEGLDHGTVSDLVREFESVGLLIEERTLVRNIEGSRTDLLLLDLTN